MHFNKAHPGSLNTQLKDLVQWYLRHLQLQLLLAGLYMTESICFLILSKCF